MHHKRLLFTLVLFSGLISSAQSGPFENGDEGNNIIKLNILSLPLKNLSVQYEKVLSKNVSVALGVRYMPMTALPFKGLLIDQFADTDQDTKDIINKSRLSNFAVTPELRFYLGKGYGQGFYVAPYYRFARFSSNTITLNYSEPGGAKHDVYLNGDMHAHTGGLMFGAQWLLGNRFVLDWWILGAQYGSGSGNFSGVSSRSFTAGEQADIKQTLEELDIPIVEKTVNVTANKVSVAVNGPFGGARAGISFGVRF